VAGSRGVRDFTGGVAFRLRIGGGVSSLVNKESTIVKDLLKSTSLLKVDLHKQKSTVISIEGMT